MYGSIKCGVRVFPKQALKKYKLPLKYRSNEINDSFKMLLQVSMFC